MQPIKYVRYLLHVFVFCTTAFSASTILAANKVELFNKGNLSDLLVIDRLALDQLQTDFISSRNNQLMNQSSDVSLVFQSETNNAEFTTRIYKQFYDDIELWNQEIAVMFDKRNQPVRAYGQLYQNVSRDLAELVQLSTHSQNFLLDQFIQTHYSDSARTFRSKSTQQIIWLDDGTAKSAVLLEFFTDVKAANSQPEKVTVVIDSDTGEVLHQFDALHKMSVAGAGPSGNEKDLRANYDALDNGEGGRPLATFLVDQRADNRCYMDAANVETRNANNLEQPADAAFNYDCADTTTNNFKEVNTAKSPLNDAHYNAQLTSRMYEAYLNIKPFNEQKIVQHAHYGINMDNAFYESGHVYYGDGNTLFYPMTSLSVVAHEIAHGYTAGHGHARQKLLIAGPSRAINEAFSDMSAEAAEFYSTGKNDWRSNWASYRFEGALRYLDTPTKDGYSVDHLSDYDSQLGEHYNAGIFNKAFYSLATLTDSPWNTKYAFIAFSEANQRCWIPSSSFTEAADCVMQQASILASRFEQDNVEKSEGIGWTSTELKNHVRKAFSRVGVSLYVNLGLESDFESAAAFNTVSFQSTSRLAGQSLPVTGWQYLWDFGDGTATSSLQNPSHVYTSEGTYDVTLTLTGPGDVTDTIVRSVSVVVDYCAIEGTDFDQYFLSHVSIGGNLFESGATAYSNNSESPIRLPLSSKPSFDISAGDHADTLLTDKRLQLWLDKDRDGVFDRASELVSEATALKSFTGVIDFIGEPDIRYRLRIILQGGLGTLPPCAVIADAEIEDYSLVWDSANNDVALSVSPVQQLNKIEFQNLTQHTTIDSWLWDFGDGQQSTEKAPEHAYQSTGRYSVSLVAYNESADVVGAWQRMVDFVATTRAEGSVVVIDGTSADFDASASVFPANSTLMWDFGDGQQSTTPVVQHTYAESGRYTANLTITNVDHPQGVITPIVLTIGDTAAAPIVPQFSYQVSAREDGRFTVDFINTTIDPQDKSHGQWDVSWDFGNQRNSRDISDQLNQSPNTVYDQSGEYNVTLSIRYNQATNSGFTNISVTESYAIDVSIDAPLAYCEPSEYETDYEFIGSTLINGMPFSNNDSGGLLNPASPIPYTLGDTINYRIVADYLGADAVPESYQIWFDLNGDQQFGDGDWLNDSRERMLNVYDSDALGVIEGSFTLPLDRVRKGVFVTRMRVIQFYEETPPQPSDVFNPCATGFYGEYEDYLFEVTNPLDFEITIEPLDYTISISNLTEHSSIAFWHWDFGDGTTSDDSSPSHTFQSTGDYPVTVQALDKNRAVIAQWTSSVTITGSAKNDNDKKKKQSGSLSFLEFFCASGLLYFSRRRHRKIKKE